MQGEHRVGRYPTRKLMALVVVMTCTGLSCAQQLPPPEAWETRQAGDSTFWRQALWNFMNWSELQPVPDREPVARIGLDLLYDASEIPGMPAIPHANTGAYGGVRLDRVCVFTRHYETLTEYPVTAGTVSALKPAQMLTLQVEFFPTAQEAVQSFRRCVLGAPSTAPDIHSPRQMDIGLPSGSRLGETFAVWQPVPSEAQIRFVLGRVKVTVWLVGYVPVSLEFAEALAWGTLHRVLQYPELLPSGAGYALEKGEALLDGIKVAPLARLKEAMCELQVERPRQRWSRVVRNLLARQPAEQPVSGEVLTDWLVKVTWGQRWVELRAFSREMKTWDGRVVKLSRPTFPYRGDLVAPLEEVKQVLGIQ